MHNLVLAIAFAPYAFFAVKDGMLHVGKRKARAVTLPEHLVHVVIIVPLAWLVGGVFTRNIDIAALGLATFLAPALADELVWHRKLPDVETNAHAKGHLALLAFLAVAALVWLDEAGVAHVLPW